MELCCFIQDAQTVGSTPGAGTLLRVISTLNNFKKSVLVTRLSRPFASMK
jgi:hypothetical protein